MIGDIRLPIDEMTRSFNFRAALLLLLLLPLPLMRISMAYWCGAVQRSPVQGKIEPKQIREHAR